MKRYALFTGNVCYPAGGWDDFAGTFDTITEARWAEAEKDTGSYPGDWWWHVVDLELGLEVAVGNDIGRPRKSGARNAKPQ